VLDESDCGRRPSQKWLWPLLVPIFSGVEGWVSYEIQLEFRRQNQYRILKTSIALEQYQSSRTNCDSGRRSKGWLTIVLGDPEAFRHDEWKDGNKL
jgi:hypothetical protein